MSSALGVVKRRRASIRRDAPSYQTILVYFPQQKSIFNTLDVVFSKIFLLPPINNTQFCLKFVIKFAHNRVIGLMND